MMADVGTIELVLEWHLLQWQVMDASACGAEQRGGCSKALHGWQKSLKQMSRKTDRYNDTDEYWMIIRPSRVLVVEGRRGLGDSQYEYCRVTQAGEGWAGKRQVTLAIS